MHGVHTTSWTSDSAYIAELAKVYSVSKKSERGERYTDSSDCMRWRLCVTEVDSRCSVNKQAMGAQMTVREAGPCSNF